MQTIAMVTMAIENGKVKCHRYWPESVNDPFIISDRLGDAVFPFSLYIYIYIYLLYYMYYHTLFVFGRIEVSLTQVQSLKNFDIHHIKLEDRHSGETHRVMHLNFTTWPDHGTPPSGLPLLQVRNGWKVMVTRSGLCYLYM